MVESVPLYYCIVAKGEVHPDVVAQTVPILEAAGFKVKLDSEPLDGPCSPWQATKIHNLLGDLSGWKGKDITPYMLAFKTKLWEKYHVRKITHLSRGEASEVIDPMNKAVRECEHSEWATQRGLDHAEWYALHPEGI